VCDRNGQADHRRRLTLWSAPYPSAVCLACHASPMNQFL
jgi:hypothetical protein